MRKGAQQDERENLHDAFPAKKRNDDGREGGVKRRGGDSRGRPTGGQKDEANEVVVGCIYLAEDGRETRNARVC